MTDAIIYSKLNTFLSKSLAFRSYAMLAFTMLLIGVFGFAGLRGPTLMGVYAVVLFIPVALLLSSDCESDKLYDILSRLYTSSVIAFICGLFISLLTSDSIAGAAVVCIIGCAMVAACSFSLMYLRR